MEYSVIIPVLNEADNINRIIQHVRAVLYGSEIIIADGGSTDGSVEAARNENVIVIETGKCRGEQLNRGVEESKGGIIIFLHADTFLPGNAGALIKEYFSNSSNMVSLFRLKFLPAGLILNLYSFFSRFESVFTSFGDQVIAVRRKFYEELGGFKTIPICEDVDFLRRARKKTKIGKLPAYAVTSARRFIKHGKIKTQLMNIFYLIRFLTGTNPQKIYNEYFNGK